MQYGAQVVSLGVLAAVLINYFRNTKMPLTSTRLFTAFLVLAFLNITAECGAVYTLRNLFKVGSMINRLCHQMFFLLVVITAGALFFYIDIKLRTQRRYTSLELAVRLIPVAGGLAAVTFCTLEYRIQNESVYSIGSMWLAVYIFAGAYLLAAVLRLRNNKIHFSGKAKLGIYFGMAVWTAAAVLRLVCPWLELASMGTSMLVLFIYLSYDVQWEYKDTELDGVLNRHAMEVVLAESFEKQMAFWVAGLVVYRVTVSGRAADREESVATMECASEKLKKNGVDVYRSRGNTACLMTDKESIIETLRLEKWGKFEFLTPGGLTGSADCVLNIIECPGIAPDVQTVMALMDYSSSEGWKRSRGHVRELDSVVMHQMNHRMAVEELLKDAVRQDGLMIYYQPIYSVREQRFVSAEALARLKDTETLGFVSPDMFIPIAEEQGLIGELGGAVFEKVCAFAKENQLWRRGVSFIEVNVSRLQSVDENLTSFLREAMEKNNIDPSFISLEFTESAYIDEDDEETLRENLQKLKEFGCKFCMDDFGTGCSKLSKLTENRFGIVKLDKSFIWSCFSSKEEQPKLVLASSIDMLHRIGVMVVAEGVETAEQASFFAEHGVEYLQGYFFARPMPEKSYLSFIDRQAGQPVRFDL